MTILPVILSFSMLGATDSEQSVVAGREALDQWWWREYPWYDSDSDAVRRVDIYEPWDWDWLDWSWLSWPGSLMEWIAWILIAVLLGLVIFLLVRAYLSGRRGGSVTTAKIGGPSEADQRERIESLPFPIKAANLDLLAEARRYYRQANYGDAIKYLFSYQLVKLDQHQMIRLTRGKTNRQYLREISRQGAIQSLLERTMVTFEDFFFGNRVIGRERFEWCWTRLEQFETLVAERAG